MIGMKEKLLLSALILFGLALVFAIIAYFMFHHLGKDLRFHKEKKDIPEKPFITNMQGMLVVFMLASSIVVLVIALMCF